MASCEIPLYKCTMFHCCGWLQNPAPPKGLGCLPSTGAGFRNHPQHLGYYPIHIPLKSHSYPMISPLFLVRSLYFDGLTEFNHHCYVGFHCSYRIFISTAARKTQAQRSPRSVCIGPFFWATCQDPTSHTWEPSTVKEWDKLLMDSVVFIYIYIRVIYCNINNIYIYIYICVCACIHIYIYRCVYIYVFRYIPLLWYMAIDVDIQIHSWWIHSWYPDL